MAQEPKYQKNMLLPEVTVNQIRVLKTEYGSDTAVVIAAVQQLINSKKTGVLA